MSAQDLEQRARDLLAAEYNDSNPDYAEFLRSHSQPPFADDERAIRAIVAALRQQPAPVDLEQFREAVEFMLTHGTREQCIRAGDMLQAIIDNAGKVETAGVPTDGGLAQRGEAWLKVAQTLNWYAPWWLNGEGTGREKAVAAIKKMAKAYGATQPAPVVDDAMVKRVWELYWRAEKSGDVVVTEKEMHDIARLIAPSKEL